MEPLTPTAPSLQQLFELLPTQAQLVDLAKEHAEGYKKAAPYPHIVLDDVFPPALLDRILSEFPSPGEKKQWSQYSNDLEAKLELSGEEHWGPYTRALMHYLNAQPFLRFLEKLTGIDNLIPDPHFQGAGLHQTVRGGYLKIHADFNKNPKNNLDRRLNALIYLNKDWEDAYGGHFEMWDQDMQQCEKKVAPRFNRLVVFSTTDFSYHGLPDPLTCPEGMTRKSLALYYYSNGRPAHEVNPGDEEHTTLFKLRPGEDTKQMRRTQARLERQMKRTQLVKSLTPPILWEGLKKLKNRDE